MSEETIEEITPEKAKEYLSRMIRNRRPHMPKVRSLVRSILAGEWSTTHQGIAFDWNGSLMDGQHRMLAVVESGRSIRVKVSRGHNPDDRTKIDIGAGRTGPDALKMDGDSIKEARVKSAMARMLARAVRDMFADNAREIEEAVRHFPEGIDFVVKSRFVEKLSVQPVYTAIAIAFRLNPAVVSSFYERYLSGQSDSGGDPAFALRDFVVLGKHGRTHGSTEIADIRFRIACTCLLASIDGRPCKRPAPGDAALARILSTYGLTLRSASR